MSVFARKIIFYFNDIQKVNEEEVTEKINENARLAFSFTTLLISSSIICTLGLLLDAPPIVIGGMIISPLMWPLLKFSLGVNYKNRVYIRQSTVILIVSILITVLSSSLITYISPIKLLSHEIISRTAPTLLDLIVALVAGVIAALAISQPRISESLAGVAIATSIMPPLCVSAIGIALGNFEVFSGGFILFFANIISIVFACVLTFTLIGIKRTDESAFRNKGIFLIGTILLITAIPLFIFLKDYSFKTVAVNIVQNKLKESLWKISEAAVLESVKTDISKGSKNNIIVEASVLLPEDLTLNYNQQQKIIDDLQNSLNKKVELNLKLQRRISITSRQDMEREKKTHVAKDLFLTELEKINPALSIDSIQTTLNEEKNIITIETVLRGDPSITLTFEQRDKMEKKISGIMESPVTLNIEIISRIKLKSNPDELNDSVKKEIQRIVKIISEEIDINSLSIQFSDKETQDQKTGQDMMIDISLIIPEDLDIPDEFFVYTKFELEKKFSRKVLLTINTISKQTKRV